MDLLGGLGVLVHVAKTGSFSAVAREREVTQAAVAHQVSQLEDYFGVRLFHRTTRTQPYRRWRKGAGFSPAGAGRDR